MANERLHRARELALPDRRATLLRDPAVSEFWSEHRELLAEAWREWEAVEGPRLPTLDDTLIDPRLRAAIDGAWADPTTEDAVRALWHEVVPGVYEGQFFDPERLGDLRAYLDAAYDAQIPVRPPYGIVLNRRGVMLDPRSHGFLAGPRFQAFYDRLIAWYFRPISRLLFPEVTGYDTQSFGFSIEYRPTTDTSIRPHTDASATTLNLNLNLPGEAFAGSDVDFYAPGARRAFVFGPGTAAIHRGNVAHAARPITEGQRTNLVLWLYGERGRTPLEVPRTGVDARQRWHTPDVVPDGYAPF